MSFILQTKLNRPQLSKRLILRQDLIEKLIVGLSRKLTIISAPAGYGKTTTLCQWLDQINQKTAWYSVDKSDNESVYFFTYLLTAVQSVCSAAGNNALKILQSQTKPPSMEYVLGSFINEISTVEKDIVLIIDDYHLIDSMEIHKNLNYLIEHLPIRMHVVIATRSDPPLKLARLRSQNQIIDLRANELSFSMNDTILFFNKTMCLNLSEVDINKLNKRIEGWIAGLQMAAISMQGRNDVSGFVNAFTGSTRFIMDYLIEEVFTNQPECIQEFLTRTSILNRMNCELCNEITEQTNGQEILEQLEQKNLFIIPLDEQRNWYRYHHLFADLLQKRLRQSYPDQIKELHQRASLGFEEQNLIQDAINHALKAEDFCKAEYLISQIAEGLWRQGEQGIILGWLKKFPANYEKTDSRLCAVLALIVFLDGRYDEAEDYIHLAEKNISHLGDEQFRGVIAAIRSYIADYRGRIEEALKYGNIALSTLTDKDAIWRSLAGMALGDVYVQKGPLIPATESYGEAIRCSTISERNFCTSLVQHRFVVMCHRRGQLKKAIQLIEQFLSDENQLTNPSGALYLIQGELLYDFNRLEEAKDSLLKALQLCKEQHHAAAMPYCHVQLARIYMAQQNHSKAEDETHESMKSLRQLDVPHWVNSFTIAWQIYYSLKKGDLHKAENFLSERNLPIPCKFNYPNETEYLGYARLLVKQNKFDQAINILQQLDEWLVSIDWINLALEVKLVWANSLFSQGMNDEALKHLEPALKLADAEGYRRTFIDESESMCELLGLAIHKNIQTDYVTMLLAETEGKQPKSTALTNAKQQGLLEPLSERELQVLRWLNSHLTNQEIGRELYISTNTVRTHIKSIYGKLNVHNRREALEKAQKIDLI